MRILRRNPDSSTGKKRPTNFLPYLHTPKTKMLTEVWLGYSVVLRNNRSKIQNRESYPSGRERLGGKRKQGRREEKESVRAREREREREIGWQRGRGRREHAAGWLVYSSAYSPLVDGAARNAQLLRNQCASPPCLMLRIRSPSEAAHPRPF